MRVFGYLGGLFVFAGLGSFVQMEWSGMGAFGHIMFTLGFGFLLFVMAVTCAKNDKFAPAATPLFLISALMQPTGIAVVMDEFSKGGNPAHGLMFMLFIMAVQQGCTFRRCNRTVLAFTTLVFAGSLFAVIMAEMRIPEELIGLVMGLSLMCVAGASTNPSTVPSRGSAGSSARFWFWPSRAKRSTVRRPKYCSSASARAPSSSLHRRAQQDAACGRMLATLSFISYFMEQVFRRQHLRPHRLYPLWACC